ncbi:MAG: RES family NAD+ phosphorylase [Coriobacteriia bacterium]|nr:RES family NAD+ phosphorylase [Coriobacteriia bacterium]
MDEGFKSLEGTFFRCTSRKREPLDTTGALLNYGRYNVKGCGALYLASSANLAVTEHLHLNELFEVREFPPRLLVAIRVQLARMLDLTDDTVLSRLGLQRSDLLGPYSEDAAHPSVTQTVAIEARKNGIEGIVAPSALIPDQTNLVVFRDNLPSPDALQVIGFDDHLDEERVKA